MSDAHSQQMLFLLGFVGLLFFVIVGVIALSQIKKNKKPSADINDTKYQVEEKPETPATTVALESTAPVPVHEAEPTLQNALKKTEENFFGRIRRAFTNTDKKAVFEQLEEILYTSDLGPNTVQKLMDAVEEELSNQQLAQIEPVKRALRRKMSDILQPVQSEKRELIDSIKRAQSGPTVLMVVGVNGAGKTTSIGKISALLAAQQFKVLVAAGDTFRAAAGGQLKTWTERAQVEIFWPENTTDPSAVAYDALAKAKAQNYDFVILDTAGRLHTQSHLMEELKKVKRVMTKVIPDAPHETWIVLDANSGQNALLQAQEFHQALQLSGIVLTKMDGTAKGGVALGVVDRLQIPVKLVGIGEKINHLKPFDYVEYIDSILGSP